MATKLQVLMQRIASLTNEMNKMRAAEAAMIARVIVSLKAQMRKHGITVGHLTGAGASAKVAGKPVAKPAAKPVAKSASKSASKPVAKSVAKPGKTVSKLPPHDNRLRVKPKYRNTKTGETWAGRGQQPKWMVAQTNAGKKADDFLIK